MLIVSVKDQATVSLLDKAQHIKAARDYALASTGKMLRTEIKSQGRSGAGYLNWPKLSPFTGTLGKGRTGVRRTKSPFHGRGKNRHRFGRGQGYGFLKLSTRLQPLQKLISAARTEKGEEYIRIGFLDSRLERMMKQQAGGFSTAVTPRMRKLYFALGLAIPAGKTEIKTPARELVQPVFQQKQAAIGPWFKAKMEAKLQQLRVYK